MKPKLPNEEQDQVLRRLNELVRQTDAFRAADANGKLIRVPTGDGMALIFFDSGEAPANCALQIAQAAAVNPRLRLRMGIHSGPVNRTQDVNERSNVSGAGINMAQRVMDCGDAGHILLSRRAADDLAPLKRWQPNLHDLGEAEVKHGINIPLVNLFTDTVGNPKLPNKLKREAQLRARKRRKVIAVVGAGVAAIALIGLLLFHFLAGRELEKSIAVLPFENLSAEKENAYFAGGIQDEILTNLAKIGDLKVISRSSVMAYASNRPSVREIAKALGVAAVVEGSVQRFANRIRISVQLINAASDQHVWAENYEKDISDIFAAQRDAAFEIASKLHAQLSPNEKARLQQRPTTNSGAYLVYLQAQDALWWSQSQEEVEKVVQLYQKATELDPTFALAFAKLSYMQALMYYNRPNLTVLKQARAAANDAIRLQPDLPEAHFALAYIHLWGDRDYGQALAELDIAKVGLPNDADIFAAIANIERRQGKWAESTKNYEKAAVLNPKDTTIWTMGLAGNYSALRDYSNAAKMFDRGIATDPNFFYGHLWKALLDIESRGDTRAMEQLLAKTPENVDADGQVTFARYELKIFERKYDDALSVLDKSAAEEIEGWFSASGGTYPKSFLRALAYRLKNDSANAYRYFEELRPLLERRVEENQTLGPAHALLGQVYAGLDRRDDAIREGKRALELWPESEDAFHGPHVTTLVAEIYAMLPDADAALPLLEHLVSAPNGLTPSLLKLDPIWDSLRSNPRFAKLIATTK
jgi:TolB-like protein